MDATALTSCVLDMLDMLACLAIKVHDKMLLGGIRHNAGEEWKEVRHRIALSSLRTL